MRNAFLMIVVAAASSFVVSVAVAQSPTNSLRAQASSLGLKYGECVIKWVGDNLIAKASPSEMADGGHSACENQLLDYEEAVTKDLLSVGGTELGAINHARSMALSLRERAKNHIIKLIIEVRSEIKSGK